MAIQNFLFGPHAARKIEAAVREIVQAAFDRIAALLKERCETLSVEDLNRAPPAGVEPVTVRSGG